MNLLMSQLTLLQCQLRSQVHLMQTQHMLLVTQTVSKAHLQVHKQTKITRYSRWRCFSIAEIQSNDGSGVSGTNMAVGTTVAF